tara:strand:+ start:146 stop:466 length:321 start_codon:yes stop_codon:yes gene_type:complete
MKKIFLIPLLIFSFTLNASFIDKSQKEKIPSFEDISEYKTYYLNRLNIMELNGFDQKIIQSERKKILALSKTVNKLHSNVMIPQYFLSKNERIKLEELLKSYQIKN